MITDRVRAAGGYLVRQFSVLSALVCLVALAAAGVAFALSLTRTQDVIDHNQHLSDLRFCRLTAALTAPAGQPPSTAYGMAIDQAARDLSHRLGCDQR